MHYAQNIHENFLLDSSTDNVDIDCRFDIRGTSISIEYSTDYVVQSTGTKGTPQSRRTGRR